MSEVRVLLFGALRQLGGAEISVAAGDATVADVWDHIARTSRLRDVQRDGLRCARNLEYCSWNTRVHPGDELAFMPPVCGGSVDDSAIAVALTDAPIDVGAVMSEAARDEDGAVACFVGRVRNHSDGRAVHALDYEAYTPMALAMMRRIAVEARARHGLTAVALRHRVGSLSVGDVSVLVVTTSPHRGPALDACREIIDAVKSDVPIWKREHTDDGAHWVDARCVPLAHV